MTTATTNLGPLSPPSKPEYLGRDGYRATQEQIDALPDYHAAFNQYGYKIPAGSYRTISASTHLPAIIDVIPSATGENREVFSRVEVVK